jgi:hypothetical protein
MVAHDNNSHAYTFNTHTHAHTHLIQIHTHTHIHYIRYKNNKPPLRGVFWTLAIWALIHLILFSWFVAVANRKLDDGEKREQSLLEREKNSDEKDREREKQKKRLNGQNRQQSGGFDSSQLNTPRYSQKLDARDGYYNNEAHGKMD